ncbi:hypothetical protein HH219_12755 [Pseudoalteromonas sp. NEC-BIFX-2020_015]|uniref:hypothetical protein n=1 Tax=Pseudoalteromonas sp. NEC-BIFX-2020_015 TaxID=2729544 RepID=UPI0014615B1C|nr:hypothetical protein [Pseudoalteromonas sp. NEC-BIFX-2020_015]NMR26391.1 hypothetical protein [Pseudoalteromonas sp. NEC-BIFX-2020_015]
MSTLIPFALDKSTQKIVSIDEVAQGKNCNCICLSCNLDLVASKGEVNVHHFKHKNKDTTEDACEISFERCVFWMCREVFESTDSIALPAYNVFVTDPESDIDVELNVIPEETASFSYSYYKTSIALDQSCTFFVCIDSQKVAITVNFDPDFNSKTPYVIDGEKLAHIIVDLEGSREIFERHNISFRQVVIDLLTNDIANKKWLYHPFEEQVKKSFYDHKLEQAKAYAAKQVELECERLAAIERAIEEQKKEDAKTHAERERERLEAIEAQKIREAQRLQAKNNKVDFSNEDKVKRIGLIECFDSFLLRNNEIKRCSRCHFPQIITLRKCDCCGYSFFESNYFSITPDNLKIILAHESLRAISDQELHNKGLLDLLISTSD